MRSPYPLSRSAAPSRAATRAVSASSSSPVPGRWPRLDASDATGAPAASSASAGYGPAASATQNAARNRSRSAAACVRAGRRASVGRLAVQSGQQRGRVEQRPVHVRLRLGQRDRRLGDPAVGVLDRVAGVLPALVGQAAPGRVDVPDEAVAAAVRAVGEPADRGPQRRQQLPHRGRRQPPPPGVVQQRDPQRGRVDRAVVDRRQPVAAGRRRPGPDLVQDLARLLAGRPPRPAGPAARPAPAACPAPGRCRRAAAAARSTASRGRRA